MSATIFSSVKNVAKPRAAQKNKDKIMTGVLKLILFIEFFLKELNVDPSNHAPKIKRTTNLGVLKGSAASGIIRIVTARIPSPNNFGEAFSRSGLFRFLC